MLESATRIIIVLGLLGGGLVACTANIPEVHGFLMADSGSGQGSSASSGGGSSGPSGSGSSGASTSSGGCSACVPGDDGGSSSGSTPTGDDASLQDGTSPPPAPDSGNPFPPFTFPDSGFSTSSSSGGPSDGGSPCHGMNKICIDPVFDCILQGCGVNSACVGAICQ